MKYFQVGTTSNGDEYVSYEGTSLEEAKKALEDERYAFENLHSRDKKYTEVWGRVYDLPDDVNLNDEDELINAICDCLGYNDLEAEWKWCNLKNC